MGGLARSLKFAAVALALGAVAIIPGKTAIIGGQDQAGAAGPGGPVTDGPGGPEGPEAVGPSTGPTQQTRAGLECFRSKNGGKTDVGVSQTTIRLASTVVKSGLGESFLGLSPYGMDAVVRKLYASGGICGRFFNLTPVDDGWDAQRGLDDIKEFIREGYFALPVVPSSEGLTAAIEARAIDDAGIPVVGTDGMLRQQYQSRWVWPVATATVSTMRIMARYGYEKRGARTFGIVYDTRYRFGKEGAQAFRQYIKRLKGASLRADVGIYPQQASYSSDIQKFNSQCDKQCDFVALLLEPQTALTWIAGRPQFGRVVTSGAQTLFNVKFASSCGKPCAGMFVWTGYNPPIGNLAGLPGVAEYVADVKKISPTIDFTNQFLEGAYLGMKIFAEAVRRVGPNLTRASLRHVLNTQCFKTDLAARLCWTERDRFANKRAQAFSISVAQGAFAGFKNEQTGFIKDPTL